jgi:ABC-type phosphate/phosphonate transport system substrate-binding protein
MPAKLRESIQSYLLNMAHDEAGRRVLEAAVLTDMRKAEDRDYEPHRRMAAAVFGPKGTAGQAIRAKP